MVFKTLKKTLASIVLASSLALVPVTAYAKAPHRNNVSTTSNYATFNVNGREYQNGVSLGLETEFDIPVLDWLTLSSEAEFRHQNYTNLERSITETINDLDLDFGARTDLYSSVNTKIYLTIGGKYLMGNENMVFEEDSAHITKNVFGPNVAVGIDWTNLDAELSFSKLFGTKSSSYDRDRGYTVNTLELKLSPRLWRFELPVELAVIFGEITDFKKDYPNIALKLKIRPEFDISGHLAAVMNITYDANFISEGTESFGVGGGFKIKW